MKRFVLLITVVSLVTWSCSSKPEHPGAQVDTCDTSCDVSSHDHNSKEHGGNALAKEHAGKEHGGQPAQGYSAAQIKDAMRSHISGREMHGVFTIHDKQTNRDLELKFVKIHDPVRKIEGQGYFACTDFEVVGEPGKLYDLDFWLNPEQGQLRVTDEKIHKHPAKTASGWQKKARYTFVNDHPVAIK